MSYKMDMLLSKIFEDNTQYRISSGGITFSGGEPTLHMKYLASLAKRLHKKGIACAIETCGFFDYSAFKSLLLPYLELILFDVKLIDPNKHKEHTGRDNSLILENLRKLSKENVRVIPRTPMIPGITDTDENLSGITALLADLQMAERHVRLPYNPAADTKNSRRISIRPAPTSLGQKSRHHR